MILAPATIPTIPGLQAALNARAVLSGADFTGALSAGGGTVEFSGLGLGTAYSQRLNATWVNVATTFTALQVNVTDAVSAADSKLIDLRVGGTSKFSVLKTGAAFFSTFQVSSGAIEGGGSLFVSSGGVGGRLYPGALGGFLFTDGSVTGAFLGQLGGSTASFPALKRSGASLHFRLADDSAFTAVQFSSFTSGSGTIDGGGSLLVSSGGVGGRLYPGALGGFLFTDGSVTGAFLGQLGGSTASFPALKRSGADLHLRLADDSAFATIRTKLKLETDAAPASATAAGAAGETRWAADYIYLCTAPNTWKRAALATW